MQQDAMRRWFRNDFGCWDCDVRSNFVSKLKFRSQGHPPYKAPYQNFQSKIPRARFLLRVRLMCGFPRADVRLHVRFHVRLHVRFLVRLHERLHVRFRVSHDVRCSEGLVLLLIILGWLVL